MKLLSRLSLFLLCSTVMLWAGHTALVAAQVRYPTISPGAERTTNGSLINVGQTIVGNASSNAHGIKAGGIPILLSVVEPVLADLDGDGDVDLEDQVIFAACMAGPEVSVPPRGCTPQQFALADLENDDDVDMADLQGLINLFFTP